MSQPNAETREVLTDCTLCYHSCGTRVTLEGGRAVRVAGLESHPINRGKLCPKGEAMLDAVYSPDRLKTPLKRVGDRFEPISWDQALDEIAAKLNQLKRDHGPEVLGVFSGAWLLGEQLHWQDFAAVASMVLAIGLVLLRR